MILDEVGTLLHFKIIPIEPVLTRRYVPKAILDRTDFVTDMRDVRHYFQKGVKARA